MAIIPSICAGALFATGAVIDEKTGTTIGTAFVIAGAAWWLSRKLQSLEDSADALKDAVNDLRSSNIENTKAINSLPCKHGPSGPYCSTETKHKPK